LQLCLLKSKYIKVRGTERPCFNLLDALTHVSTIELDPEGSGMHHQQLLGTSAASAAATKKKGVRSFCIDDILSHKTAALRRDQAQTVQGIVRPWDRLEEGGGRQTAAGQSDASAAAGGGGGRDGRRKSVGDSPLDALFNMATNFEALKAKSGTASESVV
jgi:hypothetical protein